MADDKANRPLSEISTCWSVVCRAHAGSEADMEAARQELLARYGGAVTRYLHGALRDPTVATDLYQDFALRFLRGDFHRADPENGRFRNFVKTALIRMVSRHGLRRQAGPASLEIDVADPTPAAPEGADQEFLRSWRADLLARAWQALEQLEKDSGRLYYQALHLRVEHADMSSEELARRLSKFVGTSLSAAGYRQTLHRARAAFADLLLNEVTQSLAAPTPDEIEGELADLRLLEYCRPALARQENAAAD